MRPARCRKSTRVWTVSQNSPRFAIAAPPTPMSSACWAAMP
ncbi:MAG: hypothetical protein ACLR77_07690 [Oscillospiraceae bacterium]